MKLRHTKRLVYFAGLLAGLLFAGIALAQVSTNFNLSWHLLSGGGGYRSSANYRLGDALGEWAQQAASSANYKIEPGFWAGVITTTGGAPDLAIGKSGPTIVTTDSPITYTLIVSNSGDAAANTVVITDALPAGANYVSGGNLAGGIVSWQVASLAANSSTTVQFVVTATQTITNSDYRASAGGFSATGLEPLVTVVSTDTGDSYELDNTCAQARTILTDGSIQTHTFHAEGDADWVKFQVQANKTYVIQVDNVGINVDAVVMLYDACNQASLASDNNAFGPTVRLEWDAPADGTYYLQLIQNDPLVYGQDTNYDLSVAVDTQPPSAPSSLRASPANQSLIVQWRKSPERDVARYRIRWGTISGGPYGGVDEVEGADTTYHEITGLTNGTAYYIVIQALDLSGNASPFSVEIGEIPRIAPDATIPTIVANLPSAGPVHTTTLASLTVGGTCTDAGNNLSRLQARNLTNSTERWNYSLSGGMATCLVQSVSLALGDNQIQMTVYDAVNNVGSASMTIRRVSGLNGAVVIVGGHNDGFSLQSNINYATNRAYRTFRAAGFGAEDIFYLSPSPQDADNDGIGDVISTTTPANVHAALQWAAIRVGPGAPFYLYMMDHGYIEFFCADGCDSNGRITPADLDAWLDELETSSGANQVTVIYEACHSGSFIDRFSDVTSSISEDGRVVIASTGRTNNAYASAQGAYFSDAFFSAVAESQSLLASFNQAKADVEAMPHNQTPWLDDNGDGLYNPSDGAHAANRYVASSFGGLLPEIMTTAITVTGNVGTIVAFVEQGNEPIDTVWAAVYAPSFQEPVTTSLDLGVPLIELEPDPDQDGRYSANYNAFGEQGAYLVVIYAQDQAGNQAQKIVSTRKEVYLPVVRK